MDHRVGKKYKGEVAGPTPTVAHELEWYEMGFHFASRGDSAIFVCERETALDVVTALQGLGMSYAVNAETPGIYLIMVWDGYPRRGLDLGKLGTAVENLVIQDLVRLVLPS